MRIAYITAGAAGMYCGSCIRDNALATSLQKLGHDAALIPVYTPLRTDEVNVSMERVFFGALNVYLQQKFSLFRHTPRFLDWVLDRPGLLNWVGRFGSSTSARDLGELTLSMLQGEVGRQRKELLHLVHWLRDDFEPELVQITNSMLLGFVRELKRELSVPVVCAVQGEDIFLEDLVEPHKGRVLEALRERAAEVDLFVATSHYYAEFMAEYLRIPGERMRVARLGLNLDGYGEGKPIPEEPFVLGYLARVCPEKGFHLLAEAFRILSHRLGPGRIKLRAAGWLGPRDAEYLAATRRRIAEWGLEEHFEYVGEVDRQHKIDFLHSLHLLSVPTIYREPKGLFVLEALACGIPVVEPDHGAFPELLEATGGGLLVEPESASRLADGIEVLIRDRERLRELGRRGRTAVHRDFSALAMAKETLAVYEAALGRERKEGGAPGLAVEEGESLASR